MPRRPQPTVPGLREPPPGAQGPGRGPTQRKADPRRAGRRANTPARHPGEDRLPYGRGVPPRRRRRGPHADSHEGQEPDDPRGVRRRPHRVPRRTAWTAVGGAAPSGSRRPFGPPSAGRLLSAGGGESDAPVRGGSFADRRRHCRAARWRAQARLRVRVAQYRGLRPRGESRRRGGEGRHLRHDGGDQQGPRRGGCARAAHLLPWERGAPGPGE